MWQPIETAPQDGSAVLGVWLDSKGKQTAGVMVWRKSVMYANLQGWHFQSWPGFEFQLSLAPLYWQPLPDLPEPPNV